MSKMMGICAGALVLAATPFADVLAFVERHAAK